MTARERRVRDSNELLLREFGRSPTDLPNLKWTWSEDERFPVPLCHESGEPLIVYRCSCGRNKPRRQNLQEALEIYKALPEGVVGDFGPDPNHKNSCPDIVYPERPHMMMRTCDGCVNSDGKEVRNQYVLVKWFPAPSAYEWSTTFLHSPLDYEFYKRGYYEPCHAGQWRDPKGILRWITTAVGSEHDPPTLGYTEEIIAKAREYAAGQQKRREALEREALLPRVLLPGTEENPASTPFFGSVEKRQKMLDAIRSQGVRGGGVGRVISIARG